MWLLKLHRKHSCALTINTILGMYIPRWTIYAFLTLAVMTHKALGRPSVSDFVMHTELSANGLLTLSLQPLKAPSDGRLSYVDEAPAIPEPGPHDDGVVRNEKRTEPEQTHHDAAQSEPDEATLVNETARESRRSWIYFHDSIPRDRIPVPMNSLFVVDCAEKLGGKVVDEKEILFWNYPKVQDSALWMAWTDEGVEGWRNKEYKFSLFDGKRSLEYEGVVRPRGESEIRAKGMSMDTRVRYTISSTDMDSVIEKAIAHYQS
ncbi:hypothetical protein FB446DRAFT_729121 [Lentinula raphanica]|nr:hypothetical protein FB446DRAFT_729121 [Lentinula raphanica]